MPRSQTERLIAVAVLLASLQSTTLIVAQKSPSPNNNSALSEAKRQMDKGNLDESEKTLWAVLSADPANQPGLLMLGSVRMRQKRYPEAESLFRRVLQLNQSSAIATRSLAGALLAEGKQDEAIEQYKDAIQLLPQDTELRLELAHLDLIRSDFAGALSTLNGVPSGGLPASAVPLKAAILIGLGREPEALKLIPLVKGSSNAALELARVFVQAKDPEAALKTLASVGSTSGELAARANYLKGWAFQQKGELSASAESFRKAVAADPKSEESLFALAEIYAGEKKHAESLRMLQQARTIRPESPDILRHLIVEAMQSGENETALQAAGELRSRSSDPDDNYLVATVMLQQKQYHPAAQLLEDYVARRPQDAKGFLALGMTDVSLLRYDEAREALERSLKIQPDLAEAEYQLGLAFGQQGKRQEAIQCWEKTVQLQPHHSQALFSLGAMYMEEGELEKARTAFQRSLEADPNNMKTEYQLALVMNKLGDTEEAKQHFERYRKMQAEEHHK
jgi:tetratricopeptide (TPR) repeat protein